MDLAEIKAKWQLEEIPSVPDYAVDRQGNVYSLYFTNNVCRFLRKEPRLCYQRLNKHGYRIVSIRRYPYLVHRLVLEAFTGPCPEGCEGSHLDGNRTNARLDNLVWEPRSQNHLRKRQHGTMRCGENTPTAKLTAATVLRIRALAASGARVADIATETGISQGHAHNIIARKAWAHL